MKLSDPLGEARGYEQYFGLVESPFGLTPNRRFLFESESHATAIEQVTLAVRRREPLVVITGEIGAGKTMLCRSIQAVEPRTFVSVVSNPRLPALDILRHVLHDFGLTPEQNPAQEDTDEQDIARILQQFLSSLASLSAHAVIVIDDAQRLEADTWEQIRRLCSLDAGTQELLQVILVGRLELDALLERPEMRPLAECISRRHQLQPLKPHEVAQYVERRLAVARGEGAVASNRLAGDHLADERAPGRFTPVALRSLPALTCGLPRAVNVICDRALEIAHRQHKNVVDAGCVLAAARDLNVVIPFEWHLRSRFRGVVTSLILAAAALGLVARRATGLFTWPGVVTREPVPAHRELTGPPAVAEADAFAPLREAESYSVAAASFRDEARAAEVASSLRLLDLPVFVRLVEGSHAVVVGPFASRKEAVDAQAQLARVHLTNSRIVSTAPSQGAIVHPLRPVAMTGQKGQP